MELAERTADRLMAPATKRSHACGPPLSSQPPEQLGAASRHLLESFVNRHWGDAFPWGTFVVNVSGSFVLGALVGVFAHRLDVPLWLQAAATVGFLGAYTTFSTLSLQVYRSTATGHLAIAFANAFGSLAAGAARASTRAS